MSRLRHTPRHRSGASFADKRVGGRDVRNNTLTGSDINEGSLGTVPSAAGAGFANVASFSTAAGNAAAVGGEVVERLDTQTAPSTTTTIYSRNGLTLQIECDSSGSTTLNATTSVANSDIHYWGYDTDNNDGSASGITGNDQEEGDFDPGDTIDITSAVGDADGAPFGRAPAARRPRALRVEMRQARRVCRAFGARSTRRNAPGRGAGGPGRAGALLV